MIWDGEYLFNSMITGIFVSILESRFGVRPVAMAGATINSLATILGSFTANIRQLYFCTAMSGKFCSPVTPYLAPIVDLTKTFRWSKIWNARETEGEYWTTGFMFRDWNTYLPLRKSKYL